MPSTFAPSRPLLPAPAFMPGDRVERTIEYIPEAGDPRRPWHAVRSVIQRGTVETTDPFDGTLTVAWDGDWGTFRTLSTMLRRVAPADVAQEREAFGFAVGDRIQSPEHPGAVGVALELWHTPYTGKPIVRVCWGPDTRHQTHGAEHFTPAETASARR